MISKAYLSLFLIGLSPGICHCQENETVDVRPAVEMLTDHLESPHVNFEVQLSPANATPDQTVTLTIQTTIRPGWHINAVHDNDNTARGFPTDIQFTPTGLKAIDESFVSSEPPSEIVLNGETERHHEGVFSWTRRYQRTGAASGFSADGSIRFQVCNEKTCLPPQTLEFHLGRPLEIRQSSRTPSGGEPLPGGRFTVIQMEDCDSTRPRARLTTMGILLGNKAQDKLNLKGSLDVDGKGVDVYLARSRKYPIDSSGEDDTRFGNKSTYLSVDQNRDGEIAEHETFPCNLPVRILDTMYAVREINKEEKSLTLERLEIPLCGVVLDRMVPEFWYETVDGKIVSSTSILGKVTILDIWAVT